MIRIGITGHRPNRLKVPEKKLQARVRAILKTVLKAAAPPDTKGHPALELSAVRTYWTL